MLVVLVLCSGEYISVSSQRDTELADIEKERQEQLKGPAARKAELDELAAIYMARGVSQATAQQVAIELTEKDVIRAHARDELGIDVDELANPLQASAASAFAFSIGAALPLLGGAFIADPKIRNIAVAAASTVGLIGFGGLGAYLGGANKLVGALRVLLGGWIAMAITYGIGMAFGAQIG
jgi:VIT1/CCC1 family predicted Fe2+/Mn2+ transporter